MGHAAFPGRGERHARLRRAVRRPDPTCTACSGTGRFVADWKATSVPLPCPKCMAPASAGPLREERRNVPAFVLDNV